MVSHASTELLKVKGLPQVAGRMKFLGQAWGIFPHCHDDDRRIETAGVGLRIELPAVEHRHPHVEEHERRSLLRDAVERLGSICREGHSIAMGAESDFEGAPDGEIGRAHV